MADLLPITRQDMIAEVERELHQRERVYPRMISRGLLTRPKADRQTSVMREVLIALQTWREPLTDD